MTTIDSQFSATLPVSTRQLTIYLGILLIASLAQYSLSLDNGFVWDAEITFLQDPTIRDLKHLPGSFWEQANYGLTDEGNQKIQLKYYRPLVKSLHILEYSLFGADPTGYKATNIVLNAIVVLLLFLVVFLATNRPLVAFIAAILFAVNPTHAEAVYWTYSDSYILMGVFSLAAFALYQRRHIFLALLAFSLSLLCHEMAILLPVIILLYSFLIEHRRTFKDYIPTLLFILFAAGFLVLRTVIMGAVPIGDIEFGTWLNTTVVIIQRYAKIFFLPDAPVTIYARQLFVSLSPEVIISYAVVGLFAAAGVWLWLRRREYLFWYLWFFVWMSVSLNIAAFGEYLMAEKILYLASAGFCVLLALLIVEFNNSQTLVYGLLASIALSHSVITFSRATHWQDTRTYLQKGLEFAPDFFLTHYALGRNYVGTQEYDRALTQFIKTVSLKPDHTFSHNAIGNIQYLRNNLDQAISAWEKSIIYNSVDPVPYYNIGLALKKQQKYASAIPYFEKYLALSPRPNPGIAGQLKELRTIVNQ